MEEILTHVAERQPRLEQEEGQQHGAGAARERHWRLARRPPGRTNIITMKTTKAMT